MLPFSVMLKVSDPFQIFRYAVHTTCIIQDPSFHMHFSSCPQNLAYFTYTYSDTYSQTVSCDQFLSSIFYSFHVFSPFITTSPVAEESELFRHYKQNGTSWWRCPGVELNWSWWSMVPSSPILHLHPHPRVEGHLFKSTHDWKRKTRRWRFVYISFS